MTTALKHLAKPGIAREIAGRNYDRIYAYDKHLVELKARNTNFAWVQNIMQFINLLDHLGIAHSVIHYDNNKDEHAMLSVESFGHRMSGFNQLYSSCGTN